MRRGQIVIGRAPGEFTTKARPYVVVQSNETINDSLTISLCPVTSRLSESALIRIRIDPDASNGLKHTSEIEVDLITSMRKSRIESVVGAVAPVVMARVDIALKRWLAL
jgi:mRNA interferase MazF